MKTYVASHLKDMNRQVVYKIIKDKQMTSKAELSKLTGISSPTVIKIVNFLKEKGLVIDIGEGENAIGRKPQMLMLNKQLMYCASFFLEGDFLAMGVVDIVGNVVYKKNMKVKPDFDYIMAMISNLLVRQLMEEANIPIDKLFGIGIALPVIYDQKKNIIAGAPLIEYQEERDITAEIDELARKFNVLVSVENDANSQTLGEFELSGCKPEEDLVLISVGTGMGAGVILNGRLRRGCHNMCGEIGYVCFEEKYVSDKKTPGWLELGIGYKKIQEKFGIEILDSVNILPDVVKHNIIEYVAPTLALCINNISLFLDCDFVVLAGKLLEMLGQPLVENVNEHLKHQCITGIQARLEKTEDIGLIGIASMVTDKKIVEILTIDSEL